MKAITDMTAVELEALFVELELDITEFQNFEYDDEEFIFYPSTSDADDAVAEQIEDMLWSFNPNFILCECGLSLEGEDAFASMLANECENANDFVRALIDGTCGIESFVESAISADGRGHFLSSYDGEEIEIGDYLLDRKSVV